MAQNLFVGDPCEMMRCSLRIPGDVSFGITCIDMRHDIACYLVFILYLYLSVELGADLLEILFCGRDFGGLLPVHSVQLG